MRKHKQRGVEVPQFVAQAPVDRPAPLTVALRQLDRLERRLRMKETLAQLPRAEELLRR